MAEDHSVRTLADILREHGLETEQGTRPGRRSPQPARRAGAHTAPDQPAVRPAEAASGRAEARPAPASAQPAGRPVEQPVAAKPSVPVPDASALARMLRDHGLESEYGTRPDRPQPYGRRSGTGTGAQPSAGPTTGAQNSNGAGSNGAGSAGATSTAPPASGDRRATGDRRVSGDRRSADRRTDRPAAELFRQAAPPPGTSAIPAARPEQRPEGADQPVHPATGRIPAARVASEDDQPGTRGHRRATTPAEPAAELTGRQSVLAWVRFAGEMVVALGVGVGVYFAFTVLWQLVPWIAVVAAPLVVTALVAGAAWWRQRRGDGALGVRLLAVLLFAGTLLVVAPAAGLLSS
jgi:hypothetical protein